MSSLAKIALKTATKVIDEQEISKFGGELQKAQFDIYKWDTRNPMGAKVDTFKFYLNPASVKVSREVEFKEEPRNHGTQAIKFSHTKPMSLEIGELWFDTYDTRESVREVYIDKLEDLLEYEKETHVVNSIVFTWGEFSMRTKHIAKYVFALAKLDVTYTMFLPTGMPCRAQVAVCLRQVITEKAEADENPKASPDHARIYTVKRGDTLQGISRFAYDTPAEWRRIAVSNKIDDPLSLVPGQRLVLPPILK